MKHCKLIQGCSTDIFWNMCWNGFDDMTIMERFEKKSLISLGKWHDDAVVIYSFSSTSRSSRQYPSILKLMLIMTATVRCGDPAPTAKKFISVLHSACLHSHLMTVPHKLWCQMMVKACIWLWTSSVISWSNIIVYSRVWGSYSNYHWMQQHTLSEYYSGAQYNHGAWGSDVQWSSWATKRVLNWSRVHST